MKKSTYFLVAYLLCSPLYATPIQTTINNMINKVDPSINISMSVVDLNTGEILFQRNSDRALIPASNMKLFSEAAALLALGPDYRFQRQLSTDARSLDNGTLNGSLYLSLPGDPSFTSADLKDLLSSLSNWGIKKITGNVVLVSHNASIDPYPPGRDPHDITHSYGAPITPVIIDENRLTLIINPGQKTNDPALVEVSAPADVIPIHNTVKTSEKPNLSAIDYKLDMDNNLTTTGAIGSETWALEKRIAILNPLRYAQDLITHQLREQDISLDGKIIQGPLPASTLILASQQSKPLNQLMADTLKPSDNVFADSLFIHTANILNGSPINWLQANTVAKQFLQQQTGVNLSQAVLADGSGLSKHDRISAKQTVDLLSYIYTHFPITYEFIAALPISGQDGTLQKRFNASSQQGRIRAKTGTMTGIISLSGYLSTANGHTLAFAMYINRNPKTPPNVAGKYHWLIDQLCNYFLQQKPTGQQNLIAQNPQARAPFQQKPSPANQLRYTQAQWRGLEMSLRKALRGKMVGVMYKEDELILQDNNPDLNTVLNTLINVYKKYSFSIALKSQTTPNINQTAPHILWIKTQNEQAGSGRTWVLRKNG